MATMNDLALPIPSPEALAHSQALTALLAKRILASGSLSFADFMKACLYEPGLGYYAAGSRKFGSSGDFITAPLVSSLFGYTLAEATYPMIQQTGGHYLELGAGSGVMAGDILDWLERRGDKLTKYYILEVSPDCRAQQEETLARHKDRIDWLECLPEKFSGVVLANEVLDALPVHLFHYAKGMLSERRVDWKDDRFVWVDSPIDDSLLLTAIEALGLTESSRQEYLSEINPTLPMFIQSLMECMTAGQLVFLDYGFLRDTYYHPDRKMGTLMCHYRHHAHPDPFMYPGLQDLTAHVDFTAVGLAAQEAGAEVALYSQAEFLLEHGILKQFDLAFEKASAMERVKLSSAVQKLTMPHEMGELFQVMVVNL